MSRGSKPLNVQKERPYCACGNLCSVNYTSKLGFILYKNKCSSCLKFPYRQKKKPHCQKCGFIPVHKCQLDVHHIDRNKTNNVDSNLETLCANCHRLEHKDEFK